MKKGIFSKAYLGLIFLFLYAPIIVLIVFSFNESKSRALFTGFSTKWYRLLFQDELIISSLVNSLLVAVLASLISALLGTMAAVGINNMGKRGKSLMMNITYLPVINPEIVTGIAMMLLFVFVKKLVHLELGFITVLIAHVTFCLPYVILNVLPKLRQMDGYLYEAALDLGCNPLSAFCKVVIPQIMPGIVSGVMMAFTFSLDDFVITYFTAGNGFNMLSVTIYTMVRKKVSPKINALSAIIFLIVLAALILMNVIEARRAKKLAAAK
jgi:spermidine/putrescine transport system permease protein